MKGKRPPRQAANASFRGEGIAPENSSKFFQFVVTRAWVGSERVFAHRGHGVTPGYSSPGRREDASTHRCRRCCFMISFLTATLNISSVHFNTIRLVVGFEKRRYEGIDDPNCCTEHSTSSPVEVNQRSECRARAWPHHYHVQLSVSILDPRLTSYNSRADPE